MEELEVKKDPALPPIPTDVICRLEGTKGTYQLFWDMGEPGASYLLALFCYEEMVGEPVTVTGTSGKITGEVSDDAQYYAGIAPADNPDIYNKVPVFSGNPLKLNRISILEDGSIDIDYDFTGMRTDAIQVVFINEEKHIQKEAQIIPYHHVICLKDYGLLSDMDYKVSLKAENQCDDTTITYVPDVFYEIRNAVPVCRSLSEEISEEGEADKTKTQREYRLALEEGVWDKGSLCLQLYVAGQSILEKEGIAPESDGSYRFLIEEDSLAVASSDTLLLQVQMEKNSVLSKRSSFVRVMLPVPLVTGSRYQGSGFMEIEFIRECQFPHKILMWDAQGGEQSFLPTATQKERESITIPVEDGTEVTFSYRSGVSNSRKSAAYSREQPAYYLVGDKNPMLFYSDTPLYRQEEPVTVLLKQELGSWQEISGTYFSIMKQDDDYILKLDKAVWQFTDQTIRDAIRADYVSFLNALETGTSFSLEQRRNVRELLERYLPQSLEETLYYQGHYQDNFVELKPGFKLRGDFETYQYVGDSGSAAYLNGYTGTGRLTADVSLRNGKLCVDSFLSLLTEGAYVQDLPQPTGDSALCAYGGGGITDLSAPGICREYMGIWYPEHFPTSLKEGAPQVCKNPAVIGASTYRDLQESLALFRKTGLPKEGTSVMYLRGRTQLTPCIPVTVNDDPKIVPLGSTLESVITAEGRQTLQELYGRIAIKRQGLPVYLLETATDWEKHFYVYPGDEISWK